jgi:hypothetical protein
VSKSNLAAGAVVGKAFLDDLANVLAGIRPAAAIHDRLTRDVELVVVGTTPASGHYRGIGEIDGVFLPTLRKRLRSASLSVADIIGTPSRAVARIVIRAVTVTGAKYNDTGALSSIVLDINPEGTISRIRLWPDCHEVETIVFGRKFVPGSKAAGSLSGES